MIETRAPESLGLESCTPTSAAGAILDHVSSGDGFWLGLLFGNTAALERVRLLLETDAAWKRWQLWSTIAGHPDELTLLVDRLTSQAPASCPLRWIETLYDADSESVLDWDAAWDDLVLHLELGLSDLRTRFRGGLILAAPPALLERVASDSPVLWRARTLAWNVSDALFSVVDPGQPPASDRMLREQSEARQRQQEVDEREGRFKRNGSGGVGSNGQAHAFHGAKDPAPASPPTLGDRIRIGREAIDQGEWGEAQDHIVAAAEQLLARPPRDNTPGPLRLVSASLNQIGGHLEVKGDARGASHCYGLAVELRRASLRLSGSGATRHRELRELLVSLNLLGDSKWSLGEPQVATQMYAEALALARKIFHQGQPTARTIADLLTTAVKLGDARRMAGSHEDATSAYEEAAVGLRQTFSGQRPDVEMLRLAVLVLGRLAESQRSQGDLRAAMTTYRERSRYEARLSLALATGTA